MMMLKQASCNECVMLSYLHCISGCCFCLIMRLKHTQFPVTQSLWVSIFFLCLHCLDILLRCRLLLCRSWRAMDLVGYTCEPRRNDYTDPGNRVGPTNRILCGHQLPNM